MSIQVGSADRYSSKKGSSKGQSLPPGPPATLQEVATPVPPDALRGLQMGPEAGFESEAPTALTVDASRPDLRTLSPFVFRVEPPIILGEVSGGLSGEGKIDLGELFSSASVGSSAFIHARSTLINADYTQNDFQYGATTEQALVLGSTRDTPDTDSNIRVPLNGKGQPGHLGQPAIADVWAALDIATQLKAIADTPPLTLLINPTTMSKTFSKLQQFTERTRFGYVFQAWGEEQPTLSITARCGAFYSGGRGVQWASRRDSASWQNLIGAFHFYRNNGYIYDTVGKSNAHLMVGALSIHYDGWIYYGHMSTFTYAFNEQNTLGGVEFSMDFTVSAMVDTAKQNTIISPMNPPNPNPNSARFRRNGSEGSSPSGLSIDLFEGSIEPTRGYTVASAPEGGSRSSDHGKPLEDLPSNERKAGSDPVAVVATGSAFIPTKLMAPKVPQGGKGQPFSTGHA